MAAWARFVVGRVLKVVWMLLVWLVIFDVAGVVVCFVIDVVPLRHESTLLLYAVWFVLGVFCGVIGYGSAGDSLSKVGEQWRGHPDSKKMGTFIVTVTLLVLLSLSALFYWLWWRYNPLGDYFVPDSAAPTLTFFVAIVAAMLLSRHAFGPLEIQRARRKGRNPTP